MKNFLPIIFFCLSLLTKGQCTWTLAVTSQNSSYELNCFNSSLNFSATHNCTTAVTYSWSGPALTPMGGSVSITAPGNYSCAVVDANACINTVTFAVSINTTLPTFTLSNLSSTWTCLNNGGTYTATALSPTTNLSFEWYDINSPPPNPPMYVSFSQVSLFVPPAPGAFIAQMINLNNGCVSTNTINIVSNMGFPTFSVTSAHNFEIGCWPQDTLSIVNVVLTNTNSTASYSFMPSGTNGPFPIPGGVPLSPTPSITAGQGTYTVVVQDNVNFCQTATAVTVVNSTSLNLSFSHTVNSNGVVSFSNTSIGTSSLTNLVWDYGDGSVGNGNSSTHTFSNGGIHYAVLHSTNPNCVSAPNQVNVNTIPCLANSNYSLVFSGTPQYWYAVPAYFGNVVNALWSWGDGTTSNSLYPSHTYSAAGVYNICLTVTVSCGNFSTTCVNNTIFRNNGNSLVHVTVIKEAPVGIQEKTNSLGLMVFPNPAHDKIYIAGGSNADQILVTIKDLEGRLLLRENLNSVNDPTEIKLNLENGIYFISFEPAFGKTLTQRLIISGK